MSPVKRRRIYKWELDAASRPKRTALRSVWERITPPWLFIGSFLGAIAIGAIGLMACPFFYTAGVPLKFVDALFTSTSAVCVTGLIVVDTATFFTVWGKLWILFLIQVGGLGIIAFTTILIMAIGGRLSLRHEALSAGTREVVPAVDYRRLARDVFLFTLALEAAGAAALAALWVPEYGLWQGLGHAGFHSISAFCNAGFSTFSSSVIAFDRSPLTLGVLMVLIVLGGLGFLTLEELSLWARSRARWRRRDRRVFRVSLHSRVVLVMTALLLAGGWVAFSVLEWRNTLSAMPAWAKLTNALFMSVTARTAGFNSINYISATDGTNFLTILLMFVGGAPGSTAGGLKVTTVALPALLAWSRLKGREDTNVWKRTVPEETIQRAVGLIVMGFALVTACILVLVISEGSGTADNSNDFLSYMFEAVSAFDTVGLSLDVTFGLSVVGKLTAILLMFLGRVGLPTVAAALTVSAYRPLGEFRYAREDLVVG